MKRKSRRKGFDPLRVFTMPFAGIDTQPVTSAELRLMEKVKRDRELGAAPRPKGAK